MLLEADGLCKRYGDRPVLDGASFTVGAGELVSIMGPSGEGKSTVARILCGTVLPDAGEARLDGERFAAPGLPYPPALRRKIQLIPQQPFASLDPRQTIEEAVAEPLRFHRIVSGRAQALEAARALLQKALLDPALAKRRPGELSGGQAQRALIARALSVRPKLLIADEATSMLDVSSQAQIIRLFQTLIAQDGISILLISHDAPLVESVSDRIYRLRCGRMEQLNHTKHTQTAAQPHVHPHLHHHTEDEK